MSLENTWRWFGPQDPISLKHISQTGAVGIVTALHQIPVGDIWPQDEIRKRKQLIEAEGLHWSVAESLPVHEHVKLRTGNWRRLIENYKQSLVNLGGCGIDIVCYNFMPLLDWSRTDLRVESKDRSMTTRFEFKAFAAFDLFVLKRSGAESEYNDAMVKEATLYYRSLSNGERDGLTQTVLLGLPGSGDTFALDQFRDAIKSYASVGDREFREHLCSFLKEITPVAEDSGVLLAIHPDDPPRPLLGMPRIVGNEADLLQLLGAYDSPANGLTFCTGSLGAGVHNDVPALVERFANRISFAHLRNVKKDNHGNFTESDHLDGDIDMYNVMRTLVLEQKRRADQGRSDRRLPVRPDHGHLTLADEQFRNVYPGYSLFGRMRGLAELRGLELGVRRSLGL